MGFTKNPSRHRLGLARPRTLGSLALVMTAMAVLIGTGISPSPKAEAAVTRIAGHAHAVTYMGVENFNGVVGVCSGNGRAVPTIVTPASVVSAPISGYLLNGVMGPGGAGLDDDTASAISYLVKTDGAVPNNHSAGTPAPGSSGSYGPSVQNRINQLAAEAAAFQGPYSIHMSIFETDGIGRHWQVDGVGVRSATGNWVPGRTITLTAVNVDNPGDPAPVTFDSTGSTTMTITSSGGPQSVLLSSRANAQFRIEATVSMPSHQVYSHGAQSSGHQIVTTQYGPQNYSGATDPRFAVFDFYPEAVTQTSIVTETRPGVQVFDTISITGGRPNSTITGRSVLYGPLQVKPTEQASAPAGTPVVGTADFTAELDAVGSATVETPALTIPAAGYYVWQEELDGDPDDTPSPRTYPFQGNYGVGTETSLIYPQVNVSTQVSSQTVMVGLPISDTVIVSGTIRDEDGLGAISNALTGTLYGPMEPVDGTCREVDWTDAPVALEFGPIAVTANQNYFTGVGEYTPTVRGCYSYGETLVVTNSQGEEIFTVEHEAGRVEQTTLADEPRAVTQISSHMARPGETFNDTVTISGTAGGAGTFEATLWGPVAPDPELGCWYDVDGWAELIESGQAEVFHTENVEFAGDGNYVTSDVQVDEIGCYTWSERFFFEDSPTPDQPSFVTPPGEHSETGLVANPAIATVASASSPYLGAAFADTITLTGSENLPGVITGSVLTAPAVNGACEDIDWVANGTEIGQIDPIATTADGVFESNAFVIDGTRALCATFAVTWTPDHEMLKAAAVVDPAGLPAETALFVPETPAVPAGEPGDGTVPLLLIGGLLLLTGGAGAGIWAVRRKARLDV